MVTVSIASLIYKSKRYADWVHESIHEFTPQLKRGEAEFYFIANDPTEDLVQHLQSKGYKHYVNHNPAKTEDELFKMGYGSPAYMFRVYRGYNKAIENAAGNVVVLVNSDNYFSPDWLENLLKYLSLKTIVCSKLVECINPKYGHVFPSAYHCEFGSHPDNFDKETFLRFSELAKMTGLQIGGAYMPCAFYKSLAVRVGLYPEGNVAGSSFLDVVATGDEMFFRKLRKVGVKHVTAMDSIVYHCKEGEMDEPSSKGMASDHIACTQQEKTLTWQAQSVMSVILKMDGENQYLALSGIEMVGVRLWESWLRKLTFANFVVAMKRILPARMYGVLRSIWYFLRRSKRSRK